MTESGDPRPPIADTGAVGTYAHMPTGSPNSWLRPKILWRSRNDMVARVHDPVDALREAWLSLQGVPTGTQRAGALRITGHEELAEPVFMLLGDTGEGDGSQMAVVPGLVAMSEGADFSIVCSDVIYPAGEAADYFAKFYTPYRNLQGPIYAVPGNHDWYDRLVGFMTHFCDARSVPATGTGRGRGPRGWLANLLWRKEATVDTETVIDGARGLASVLKQKIGAGVDLTERETHFFPARAWSLYWYAKLLGPRDRELLSLTYAEAGAVMGEELDLEPLDPAGKELRERYRRDGMPLRLRVVRTVLLRRLPAPGKLFQRFLSEIIDQNVPPMAKSFLRVEVIAGQLRIRCFQATGWLHDEAVPPVEDEVTISLN